MQPPDERCIIVSIGIMCSEIYICLTENLLNINYTLVINI